MFTSGPVSRCLLWQFHLVCFLSTQAVCQLNSALSTIHRDVTVLIRSAAVGFDSLPREMVAILEAVWSGRMPLKWYKGVSSEAVSLKDGMTGTVCHHELLAEEVRHCRISTQIGCPTLPLACVLYYIILYWVILFIYLRGSFKLHLGV